MKKIIVFFVAYCTAISVQAQMYDMPLGTSTTLKSDKTEYLFNSDEIDLDWHFKIKVSKDVVLMFEMSRAGLWQGKEEFRKPLLEAAEQLKLYADSMRSFVNTKRLDIHLSPENKVISRLTRSFQNNNVRIALSGSLEAFKMTNDTLRIVKSYGKAELGKIPLPERQQYTFSMKELNGFSTVLLDDRWIDDAVHLIDSVVNVYKKKWYNPDAEFHTLYVKYNPVDSGANRVFIRKRNFDDYNRMSGILTINGGFSVSLVRNTLCPGSNFGFQFHFKGEEDYVPFVRLSMNTFLRFEEQPDKKFSTFSTGFVNAELGIQAAAHKRFGKDYHLSVGIGYKITPRDHSDRDPSMDRNMYKLFFNYGLSKSILLQPEIITNFKKDAQYNGWVGMTINLQLF